MNFDFDEPFEVDSTTFFRQEATDLTHLRTLDETLDRFGLCRDDRIERTDLVKIYRRVEKEMENEIFRLANTAFYREAKEMRGRLGSLRAEFDSLQTNGVKSSQRDQNAEFQKGSEELFENVRLKHMAQKAGISSKCAAMKADQDRFHQIQWENLELTISRIPRPHLRSSKKLIELMKAELGLIKTNQYEDAEKVHRMVSKILPSEEKAFFNKFDKSIESRRENLRNKQLRDSLKLEEAMKAVVWDDIRSREMELKIQTQRVKNHEIDMGHAHLAESRLRPEMSVKPSALWQKRPGFESTAASTRGHQLLAVVRGKKEGEKVFADTLVDKHNFVDSLQDTITLP